MDKFTSIIDIGKATGGGAVSAATSSVTGSSENESICPSLSFKQRLIGCASMMGLGMLFSILGVIFAFLTDYVSFGIFFTLGNITSIGSTLFLAGPVKQFKNMFNEGRWIASSVYLVSMIVTILMAVLVQSGILVLICCLVQYLAMWWYFLSYVPFARDVIKSAISNVMSRS